MKQQLTCVILMCGMLGIGATGVLAKDDSGHRKIELQEAVHFVSLEGQDVVIPSGAYIVEKESDESLRVVAIPEMDKVLLQAIVMKHEELLQHPEALSVREGEDRHHILLLFPNGKALGAVGSYSGIKSRSRISPRLSPARLRQRLASGNKSQQPRDIPIPRRFRENQSPQNEVRRDGVIGDRLSRAKILELERKRDRIMKDLQRQPGWQRQLKDFVGKESGRLEAENRLIANLAKKMNGRKTSAFPDVCKTPQVKDIAVTRPLEPNEKIILNGCGFGDQIGNIQLESHVFPGGPIELKILAWSRKAIAAQVPSLKGVKPSRFAWLRVIKKDLTLGEPIVMPFKATVSCELINPSRVTVFCAESGACKYGGDPRKYTSDVDKKYFGNASFGARHGIAKPFNAGADKVKVALGGGWRLQGMDYLWRDGQTREELPQRATAGIPKGFKMKARKFTITMPWASWQGGTAVYGVKLLACGPWGVPY